MSTTPHGPLIPVLDESRLRNLARDTSSETAEHFANNYARMLVQRVQRLNNSMCSGDLDAALDAALSLKASSSFMGARRMENICGHLHAALRSGDSGAARKALKDVETHLPHLAVALTHRTSSGMHAPDPPCRLAGDGKQE